MRKAYISILTLLQYDEDLFENLQLPSVLDKDVFINELVAETAELEVIYPDPEIMSQMIGNWSASRIHS